MALMALLLQSIGPLAQAIDKHYRNSLIAAMSAETLKNSICSASGSASAQTASTEQAQHAKKLRCPCFYGCHSCVACVANGVSLTLFCLLVAAMAWMLALLPKDALIPPRRDFALRQVFRLALSPRAPPAAFI
jgi:hypothetical protein